MTNFTDKQTQAFISYLNLCVEEGYMDETDAQELIDKKMWNTVQYMMEKGDYHANQ